MELFRTITSEAAKRDLGFLVIGGLAVGRFLKDFLDVENLVRIHKLNMQSERMRELFLKYGTNDLYEKVSQSCKK